MTTDLITRLSDEADLCRNDGADDIARLLDEAAAALRQPGAGLVAAARQAMEALEHLTGVLKAAGYATGRADAASCDLRAALAEQAAEQAPNPSYPHITQPYTLEEIRAQIASHDYSAELLLQHAMLLLDAAEQASAVQAVNALNTWRPVRLEFGVTMHRDHNPPSGGEWLKKDEVLAAVAGAAPAAEQAEPVAWMDPATLDVIHAERRRAWRENYGHGGRSKAATYTVPLYTAPPAPARQEPLFLLHTGQIDSGGEQDEWDIEANSWASVEEFCLAHPGQTIGLHPQHLPAAPITAAPAEGGAA